MRRSSALLAAVIGLLAFGGPSSKALSDSTQRTRAHHRRRHRHRHRHRTAHRTRASTGSRRHHGGTSTSPSGAAMPTGSPAGWREVFSDDFTGSSLDTRKWRLYWGQPGGDPGGWFDPNHVSVSHGELVISAYRDATDGGKWATGGISSSPAFVQTYGKYLVRLRMDSGVGISQMALLWPADNSWPPEIDFSEDNATNRQTLFGTLHYGPTDTQIQQTTAVDLTQWHTLGVEWTPGKLVYTLDGRPWATVTNPAVPAIPMALDLQTQAWACGTSTWEGCVGPNTPSKVNLDVDWVVAYAQG